MIARPYGIELGPGPLPAEVIRKAAPTAALWGRWFGGGAIVLPRPLRVQRFEQAAEAFERLTEQPATDGTAPSDVVGGGWLACLGYSAGRSWAGFFDQLWRYRPETGWRFESLGLPDRKPADRESQADLRRLLDAGPPAAEAAGAAGAGEPHANLDLTPFAAAPSARTTHLRGVEAVLAAIERGDYYQLNLCTRLRSRSRTELDPATLFAAVADRLRPDFAALIDAGDGRSLVSLSPELFWAEHDGRVRSSPIKGTTAVGQDPSGNQLAASVKDRAENVMITDLMRNDVSRVCRPGTVTVERLLELERHPGVWHLVSTVAGELADDVDAADLLEATFPPGSVTGAPKLAAMAGIADLERQCRGAYTGALGLVTPHAGAEFSVTIRTFEIDGDEIELGVGGGITVDSVPVREWYECLHKATPLVHALGAELAPELDEHAPAVPDRLRDGGVLETLLARDGEVLRLAAHLARLDRSCRELYGCGLPDELAERIRRVGSEHPEGRRRIRVVARAEDPDPDPLELTIESHPAGPAPSRIRLVRAERPDWCWRHKWADRSAFAESALAVGDPLTLPYFLSPDGDLAESSRGNLCLRGPDGTWLSPPESEYVLPGITRRDLLRALGRRGVAVRIDDLPAASVSSASAWLHASSVAGVVVVDEVDGRRLEPDPELLALVGELNVALGFTDL